MREREKKLNLQMEEMLAVFDSLDGAVYVADMKTYEILWANSYCKKNFGYDIIGRKCYEELQEGRKEPCSFCTNHLLLGSDGKPKPPVVWDFQNTKNGRWYHCIDRALHWPGDHLARMEIALDVTEFRQGFEKLQKTLDGAVSALATISEMRDPYTAGHQRWVAQLSCAIAREMGLSEDKIECIRLAGLLHDAGKIVVPAEILVKPGSLNEYEFGIMRSHSQVGYQLLKGIEFPWPIAKIVLQHHERLNGSGYPAGIGEEEILLEARILGVADTVEAMVSRRPYRAALGIDKALEEIKKNRAILYDPKVVDACVEIVTRKGFKFEELT